MKKVLIFMVLALVLTLSSINVFAKIEFDGSLQSFHESTYQVTERTAHDKLDYGIEHIRDVAKSSSKIERNGLGQVDPQVVNVLTVPSRKDVRIINWTYSTTANWNKATVTQMAEDFERKNPGWIVLAGVNGDFFDINGHGNLPFQTSGVTITNGDVIRPISSGSNIGYTNNGTEHSMIGGEAIQFSSAHRLAIYNEKDEIIKTFDVSRFNEAPQSNEISIYYTYNDSKETTWDATLPGNNSYLIEDVFRCYGMGSGHFFGKGTITDTNTEKKLFLGTFGIVTDNPEVTSLLGKGVKVRVQRDVEGVYEECDNILGGGSTILKNGNVVPFNQDDRHPRTVLGAKADGTLVFMTVDGRQKAQGMTGMTQEELGIAMKYYGCSQAYNVDGGGSTTMIIRNEMGTFDVQNSPSDGHERRDANAVLVVVPNLSVNIVEASSDSVTFSYDDSSNDVKFSNIKATITGNNQTVTKDITSKTFTWDGLVKETSYEATFEYDITYQGKTTHTVNNPISFRTGKQKPIVETATFEDLGDRYLLRFKISDPEKVISVAAIKNGRFYKGINPSQTELTVYKSKVQSSEFILSIDYNLAATPNKAGQLKVNFTEYIAPAPEPEVKPEPELPSKKGCSCKKSMLAPIALAAASLLIFLKRKNH